MQGQNLMANRPSILDDHDGIRSRLAEIAQDEGRGCQRCGTTIGCSWDHRGTAYVTDLPIDDHNNPNMAFLCDLCWMEEREYWDEMWQEYYRGLL